jgi:hypothetical protein
MRRTDHGQNSRRESRVCVFADIAVTGKCNLMIASKDTIARFKLTQQEAERRSAGAFRRVSSPYGKR